MTRGAAQSAIAPRVYQFPDGGTILSTQPVIEAHHALAEAASAALVDEARRRFDAEVERHCLAFGFDENGNLL